MTEMIQPPAARPCPSCPYQADVPSGVWAPHEYAKMEPYGEQVDHCNQRTGYGMISHGYDPESCGECKHIADLYTDCPDEQDGTLPQ